MSFLLAVRTSVIRSVRKMLSTSESQIFLVLLVPLFILGFPLMEPGTVIDDGDFPYLHNALYPFKMLSMWIDFGSHSGFETISRYPAVFLGLLLNIIGISSETISKLMVLSVFFLASASFYFSFLLFFKEKVNSHKLIFQTAAILGSLFYAYNLWSFDRIVHWYLLIGYAVFPLFFVSVTNIFRRPGERKYLFLCVITWTVASSTPHMVVLYGMVFVGVSIFFVIKNLALRYRVAKTLLNILIVSTFYLSLNSYWVYPFLMTLTNEGEPIPFYALVTEEITQAFSNDSTFLNVVRVIQDWEADTSPQHHKIPSEQWLFFPAWLVASWVFPVLAFSALIFRAYFRYALVFSLLAIAGILLAMGTNAPFNIYTTLLFEAPLFSSLQLIFREPDKFSILILFPYSFLIGISAINILRLTSKIKFSGLVTIAFLSVILGALIIYPYQIYINSFYDLFEPITIPKDFEMLNSYLANSDTDKVFFIPFYPEEAAWSNNKSVDLYSLSSGKPNIGSYNLSPYNFYLHLKKAVMENKTNNIHNFLVPFGASYVVYHNDTKSDANKDLLKRLSAINGLEQINKTGFFVVFKSDERISPVSIPNTNIFSSEGLKAITSLSSISLPNQSKSDSSVIFLDSSKKVGEVLRKMNGTSPPLILVKDKLDLVAPFIEDRYVLAPFDATDHYNPSKMWSKAGTVDPWHGEFHPHLEDLNIENWNFDYGRGLVFTTAVGTKLPMQMNVIVNSENDSNSDGSYDIFMRYLKSQKGGALKVYFDGKLLDEINTLDKSGRNNFVWENVKSDLYLNEGTHTLTLENVAGLNAVNIFAVVPADKVDLLNNLSQDLAAGSNTAYLLEAESDFNIAKTNTVTEINDERLVYLNRTGGLNYREDQGTETNGQYGLRNNLFNNHNKSGLSAASASNATYLGQIPVPEGMDLMSIYFLAEESPTGPGSYTINSISIRPDTDGIIFRSEFDNVTEPSNIPREMWNVTDGNALISYGLKNRTLENQSGFVVDLEQNSNNTNWSIISSDFIPINADDKSVSYYNYSADVSAKDVNQLHLKTYYYDSNKNEMGSDFLSGGRDGTFKEIYKGSIDDIPLNTRFMKLQLWTKPNSTTDSSFFLKDATIYPIDRDLVWTYNENRISPVMPNSTKLQSKDERLRVNISSQWADEEQKGSSPWSIISSDFIPINADDKSVSYYNYSADVTAKDVNQLHLKANYYDSNKDEMGSDFLSGGRDGTFKEKFKGSLTPPLGSRYIKMQIFVKPLHSGYSDISLDNVILRQVFHSAVFDNPNKLFLFENSNPLNQKLLVDRDDGSYFKVDLTEGNISYPYVVNTKPFAVQEGSLHTYRIDLKLQNLSSPSVFALTMNSSDITEHSANYNGEASNGRVLSLSPGSEIYTDLSIIKPSNYSMAVKTVACPVCTSLTLRIEDENDNVITTGNIAIENSSLVDDSGMIWHYLNNSVYLKQGNYELKIYSDSRADLDSVIIYSSGNSINEPRIRAGKLSAEEKYPSQIAENVFQLNSYSAAAEINRYERLSSTKHLVEISNATRPFVLSFAESYDPLWTVHIDKSAQSHKGNKTDFRTMSFPLYSIINGFYIPATGSYTLVIEYQPQEWFMQGAIMSTVTILIVIGFTYIDHYKRSKFNK